MNVRRGLIRAWIVVSILWVMICAAGWYAITYDDRVKLEVARGCNIPDPSIAGTPKALEARNAKPRCSYIGLFDDLLLEKKIRDVSLQIGAATLFVPTFVLAVGFSIAWIRRGFRSG